MSKNPPAEPTVPANAPRLYCDYCVSEFAAAVMDVPAVRQKAQGKGWKTCYRYTPWRDFCPFCVSKGRHSEPPEPSPTGQGGR